MIDGVSHCAEPSPATILMEPPFHVLTLGIFPQVEVPQPICVRDPIGIVRARDRCVATVYELIL